MKFTKISGAIGKFAIWLLYGTLIAMLIGVIGVLLWAELYVGTPIFNILWFVILPAVGLAITYMLGKFTGDKYYDTGMVIEGNTVFDVVKTPKYYRRRMYVCFIECFLFALVIVKNIVLFFLSPMWSIIGIVGSVVAIIIYFIVGMSSRELSKEKKEENNN